ncbi:hypothetical protein DXT68_16230 [Microbacterium foliorum]|uniref:Uncharacterized protein n=1 Tax=Microbacterium foliorum TaxID=104336 RepID=A0A0F0KZ05_9MICO|nr:hypothetical protein DXT68_16230 [Microbacterium foliorum]KJL25659.1 hypothetical protein RN50_00429 [Microbacterium foliorum]
MGLETGIRRYTDAFAGSLRDAINARGLTLAKLHELLRARGNSVSMATLSYWRSGARRPEGAQSMAALGDIEQLLHLAPGSLTGLLGTTNRTGPLGPIQFPLDEEELEQAVKDAYTALGAEYPDTTRELTTHSVTDVDASGNVAYSITRSILQATVGTVTSTPFLEISPGISTPPPIIRAVSGGRISAHYSHPNGEVHGVLFEFDAPLTAPATAMVEWSVEYPAGYPPQRETGHAMARQCRELLVWTRFHPDALPDRIEERVETPAGVTTTELSLEGRGSVHQVRRAFGPGALGVSWSYADGR